MKFKYLMAAVAAHAALAATSADAAVYAFDLTGGYTASWRVDTGTMLDNYAEQGQGLGFYDVSGVFGGVNRTALSLNFFNAANDGGMSIELSDGFPFFAFGEQLYTGAEADFAFRTGTFSLEGSTLTIRSGDVAAVPEAATWLTMILGFALTGGALRVRRTRVRFAA